MAARTQQQQLDRRLKRQVTVGAEKGASEGNIFSDGVCVA